MGLFTSFPLFFFFFFSAIIYDVLHQSYAFSLSSTTKQTLPFHGSHTDEGIVYAAPARYTWVRPLSLI